MRSILGGGAMSAIGGGPGGVNGSAAGIHVSVDHFVGANQDRG
jgi:hypothetical protein